MKFTGKSSEDVCPISHVIVNDLSHPVGFDTSTAYECDALVCWLKKGKSCNPLTMEVLHGRISEIIKPLIINDDCTQHIAETYVKLNRAGVTKVIKKFFFWIGLKTVSQATKAAMILQADNHAFWTTVQTIAFTFLTYFVAMGQKASEILSFSYSRFGVIVTIASFIRLMVDTCKAYPTNGRWIVLNFCLVRH